MEGLHGPDRRARRHLGRTPIAVLNLPSGSSAGLPSAAAELPRTIRGGVELTLADGDLFRVWVSLRGRELLSRRRDAATGSWSEPAVVLDRRRLTCFEVDARTANGAVAVLANCRRYPRGADQGSPSVRALRSSDTVTWSSYTFDTESFEEPAISPDGQSAVWPQISSYLTRTAAGVVEHALDGEGLGSATAGGRRS